jgi:uncharacterized protein
MEMTGEQLIPLPQEKTWRALNDTEILKTCIPGCESIDKQSDNEYLLTMTAKVGPVSAKFKGKMTLSEIDPPHAYTLLFEGQGGVAGFAKGQASVRLVPEGDGTKLRRESHGGRQAGASRRAADRRRGKKTLGTVFQRIQRACTAHESLTMHYK